MTASAPNQRKSLPKSAGSAIRSAPPKAGWAMTGSPSARDAISWSSGSPVSIGEIITIAAPASRANASWRRIRSGVPMRLGM